MSFKTYDADIFTSQIKNRLASGEAVGTLINEVELELERISDEKNRELFCQIQSNGTYLFTPMGVTKYFDFKEGSSWLQIIRETSKKKLVELRDFLIQQPPTSSIEKTGTMDEDPNPDRIHFLKEASVLFRLLNYLKDENYILEDPKTIYRFFFAQNKKLETYNRTTRSKAKNIKRDPPTGDLVLNDILERIEEDESLPS